jgi:hypothetical protein
MLKPLSKLSCAAWVSERAAIPGLDLLSDDQCYLAMDWLTEIETELAEQVYWSVATLLNLEVDLLFFDTMSTYFETDEADPPSDGAPAGFRAYNGHSKDHRPDLPQVVIGLAVTRTGIPIRVWTFPGNTADMALIRQVKDDLLAWKLGRVVWVTDRGFASAENRRYLQRAGGHYISGEKLRSESAEAKAALARQGRYHPVAGKGGGLRGDFSRRENRTCQPCPLTLCAKAGWSVAALGFLRSPRWPCRARRRAISSQRPLTVRSLTSTLGPWMERPLPSSTERRSCVGPVRRSALGAPPCSRSVPWRSRLTWRCGCCSSCLSGRTSRPQALSR